MTEKVTNDGKKGGNLVGKPHNNKKGESVGGIKAVVTDTGQQVELEGGEVIINKAASKKHWKELSKINQSAGNGVAIGPPIDPHEADPDEYKKGGKIQFNANKLPNKWVVQYAKKIKKEYPEIWKKGGNIFGNEAFNNLLRVSERGYWLDSEKWMYIKWRAFVARHKKDFRIAGVVAMLKWCDKVEKGWSYMKDLIEAEIKKKDKKGWKTSKSLRMSKGGSTKAKIKGKAYDTELDDADLTPSVEIAGYDEHWSDYVPTKKQAEKTAEMIAQDKSALNLHDIKYRVKQEDENLPYILITKIDGELPTVKKLQEKLDVKRFKHFEHGGSTKPNTILDADELKQFTEWIEDGNAFEKEKGVWVEQTTQYRKKFTKNELQKFFKREFFKHGGSTMKKSGVITYRDKYNKKYGFKKGASHSLKDISKKTGIGMKGIQEIYNKGIGAYKTNPGSVRPSVKSKEQWAYGRVYSAVMGGKAADVDEKELKMQKGGKVGDVIYYKSGRNKDKISSGEIYRTFDDEYAVMSGFSQELINKSDVVEPPKTNTKKFLGLFEKGGMIKFKKGDKVSYINEDGETKTGFIIKKMTRKFKHGPVVQYLIGKTDSTDSSLGRFDTVSSVPGKEHEKMQQKFDKGGYIVEYLDPRNGMQKIDFEDKTSAISFMKNHNSKMESNDFADDEHYAGLYSEDNGNSKLIISSYDSRRNSYDKGGSIEINEDGTNIPKELQEIFDDYNEDADSYKEAERLRVLANEIGYTFDYDLSGTPTEFQKLENGGKMDEKSKTKFYKTYYENVSPTYFKVETEDDKIVIDNINKTYPENFGPKDVKQYSVKQSMEEGGIISGKTLKQYIENTNYGNDLSFVEYINDNDKFDLKNIDINAQIQKDGTLKDYVNNSEDFKPNEKETDWLNKTPIIIGDNSYENDVVLDGYHRIKQAQANKEKTILAYVKASNYADGGQTPEVKYECYVEYLDKDNGFKRTKMQFKSYRNAEKWCRENFEKFHPDMIGYNDMKEEFKKGGKVTWKKNIGEDGWSSTMENQSAYDNVGGYISESGNWIIFRDGRWYRRQEDGEDNFKRDGIWIVQGKNEYGRIEDIYGEFETLKEAKDYVQNWVNINPQDFKKGGKVYSPDGRKILYKDENVALQHNKVSDDYSLIDTKTGLFMDKGGYVPVSIQESKDIVMCLKKCGERELYDWEGIWNPGDNYPTKIKPVSERSTQIIKEQLYGN